MSLVIGIFLLGGCAGMLVGAVIAHRQAWEAGYRAGSLNGQSIARRRQTDAAIEKFQRELRDMR